MYRRIQTSELGKLYKTDHKIRSACRRLIALPLLPIDDVQRAHGQLSEEAPIELESLFEYFDEWWMR